MGRKPHFLMLKSQLLTQASDLIKEANMIKKTYRKLGRSPYYSVIFKLPNQSERKAISTKKKILKQARLEGSLIVEEALARKKYPQTLGSHSLREAIDRHLQEDVTKNDRLYLQYFRKKIGNYLLIEIDQDLLWELQQKYLREKPGIKNQSVNRAFSILHGTLNRCLKWKWLEHAPKHYKLTEKERSLRRTITKEEFHRLKEACLKIGKPYFADILEFYKLTALRKKELWKIEKSHINFQDATLLLPTQKNGQLNQHYTINSEALRIAHKYIHTPGDYLFNTSNFRKIVERIRVIAGVPDFTIHMLRHTAITIVARGSRKRELLKAFSRHKSDIGLKPYDHLVEDYGYKDTADLSKGWG